MNESLDPLADLDTEKPDHICHIDCILDTRPDGGRSHIMYSTSPTTAAGRYQYDRNRDIYRMGKGARAAMRATGQSDTRTNREWSYGRKLWREAKERIASGMYAARSDAIYRDEANSVFGPDRRPYRSRNIRKNTRDLARLREKLHPAGISRPAYLPQSEHDPNL